MDPVSSVMLMMKLLRRQMAVSLLYNLSVQCFDFSTFFLHQNHVTVFILYGFFTEGRMPSKFVSNNYFSIPLLYINLTSILSEGVLLNKMSNLDIREKPNSNEQ